jgi:transcriptional regulator with XRE-family HTH domain
MGVPLSQARILEINRVIGKRLRAAREQLKWTLEDLGGRSGIAVATLHRYEAGKHVHRTAVLVALAEALGMDMADLMRDLWVDPAPVIPVRATRADRLDHTPERRELTETFAALPPGERSLLLEFARLLARRVPAGRRHPRKPAPPKAPVAPPAKSPRRAKR